jgi:hypothetical protein
MGQCYEFGVAIHEGCGHAMRVSDDGGACVCPTCGAHCEGRFQACGPILDQAGYVPVTAPRWAVELTERPTPEPALPRIPRPAAKARVAADDDVLPVVGAELDAFRDELRALVEPAVAEAIEHERARLFDALRAQLMETSRSALTNVRNDLLETVDTARREVADHAKELDGICDRLSASYTKLLTGYQRDRATTRSVIEELARRVGQLERGPGAPEQVIDWAATNPPQ